CFKKSNPVRLQVSKRNSSRRSRASRPRRKSTAYPPRGVHPTFTTRPPNTKSQEAATTSTRNVIFCRYSSTIMAATWTIAMMRKTMKMTNVQSNQSEQPSRSSEGSLRSSTHALQAHSQQALLPPTISHLPPAPSEPAQIPPPALPPSRVISTTGNESNPLSP
ncbi:hypothetical protein PTTG_07788, partial [Puccinia triticina 1-1 BBBD Race 1]